MANPSLAVDCPRCGLKTQRFLEYCRNCGYQLWPSGEMASAAFQAWRATDPERAPASRYDMEIPHTIDNTIDFNARARELGIHLFPNSNWPFVICLGALFLGLAAIPFPAEPRIALAIVGGLIFLWGVGGWVLVEDVRMYPSEAEPGSEVHH